MIRVISAIIIFMMLAIIQTSFLSSLPFFLSSIPLVLAVGVYILQHHSLTIGAWWIAVFGLFLDIFQIQNIPLEVISYSLAAIVAFLLSKKLFSNRSVYGVLACGIVAFTTLATTQTIIITIMWLFNPERVIWNHFIYGIIEGVVLTVVALIILFIFSNKIRSFLIKTFLLSRAHETF